MREAGKRFLVSQNGFEGIRKNGVEFFPESLPGGRLSDTGERRKEILALSDEDIGFRIPSRGDIAEERQPRFRGLGSPAFAAAVQPSDPTRYSI